MKARSISFAQIGPSGAGPRQEMQGQSSLHGGHQGKGGDECLSDRLLRVIDAKRTASKEANAQILALICDKYDDF
jgi:hypothetical protein